MLLTSTRNRSNSPFSHPASRNEARRGIVFLYYISFEMSFKTFENNPIYSSRYFGRQLIDRNEFKRLNYQTMELKIFSETRDTSTRKGNRPRAARVIFLVGSFIFFKVH